MDAAPGVNERMAQSLSCVILIAEGASAGPADGGHAAIKSAVGFRSPLPGNTSPASARSSARR
jgi:hypothetical protein